MSEKMFLVVGNHARSGKLLAVDYLHTDAAGQPNGMAAPLYLKRTKRWDACASVALADLGDIRVVETEHELPMYAKGRHRTVEAAEAFAARVRSLAPSPAASAHVAAEDAPSGEDALVGELIRRGEQAVEHGWLPAADVPNATAALRICREDWAAARTPEDRASLHPYMADLGQWLAAGIEAIGATDDMRGAAARLREIADEFTELGGGRTVAEAIARVTAPLSEEPTSGPKAEAEMPDTFEFESRRSVCGVWSGIHLDGKPTPATVSMHDGRLYGVDGRFADRPGYGWHAMKGDLPDGVVVRGFFVMDGNNNALFMTAEAIAERKAAREAEEERRRQEWAAECERREAETRARRAKLAEEARAFNASLCIPAEWHVAHKIVLSGLSARSDGTGSRANTVDHVVLDEPLVSRRLKRRAGDLLCTASDAGSFGLSSEGGDRHRDRKVTCAACLKIVERLRSAAATPSSHAESIEVTKAAALPTRFEFLDRISICTILVELGSSDRRLPATASMRNGQLIAARRHLEHNPMDRHVLRGEVPDGAVLTGFFVREGRNNAVFVTEDGIRDFEESLVAEGARASAELRVAEDRLRAAGNGRDPQAEAVVLEVLTAALPAGRPPYWREVRSARYVTAGRDWDVEAAIEFWDGEEATVRVWDQRPRYETPGDLVDAGQRAWPRLPGRRLGSRFARDHQARHH